MNKIYIGGTEVANAGATVDVSNYYDKNHIDASYGIIDASITALDASVKELASSAGGGDSDSAFVKYTNTSDSTKVGIVSTLRTAAPCTSIGQGALIFGEGIATGSSAVSFGTGKATGNYGSFALTAGTASGNVSFATQGATASGLRSLALGS